MTSRDAIVPLNELPVRAHTPPPHRHPTLYPRPARRAHASNAEPHCAKPRSLLPPPRRVVQIIRRTGTASFMVTQASANGPPRDTNAIGARSRERIVNLGMCPLMSETG